ncbi:hypothetical protein [Streptomyces profundus]|uniref:hypothetical protein n=1 Tax=Streptomyces profundus TaxID=2867410 RepID=UPI001D16324F|nr:hypothetical protein [Streptomyces sp. MA3_2.13]UED87582.1 hypothetical protein K4G22_28065 [Streptomyces sp. MA3_2.13]
MSPIFRRRPRRAEPTAPPPSPPGTGPGTPPKDPALAHAWFCERLPQLRAQADLHGWRRELEARVTAVREGRPVAEALDALLLSDQGTLRHAGEVPLREAWDRAPIGQRFHCPRSACPPRARAEDASEPWCHLDDQPLRATTYRLDP